MLFQKNIIKKYLALLEPEYNLITEQKNETLGLAKGIYIVRITTPRGIAAKKLAVE